MKINTQSRRDARTLFNACRVNGVLDEGRVRIAAGGIVKSRPRGFLGTLTHFHRLVKLDIARRTAVVESATPQLAEFQNDVKENLLKKYGPGLNIQFVVNPALIGGLRVRVGSDVLDGSVAARLNELAESF